MEATKLTAMSFFKSLFGSKSGPATAPAAPKESIFEIMNTDVRDLPFGQLEPTGTDTNVSGTPFTTYTINLMPKECGIFDRIEVTYFSDRDYNVHLRTEDISPLTVQNLGKLIRQLYFIYGVDDLNNADWEPSEGQAILNNRYWSGRMWCDSKSRPNKPDIMMSKDDQTLEMTIFGVPKYR